MPEHQQIQQSKKPDTTFHKQTTLVSQTPVSNPYSIIQRAKINPKSLTHADVMQLQRTIGNRAVAQLLSGIGNPSTAQQATVQRQEIPEEEELLQGRFKESIQRQEIPEEEEPLQGKMIEIVQKQEIPEEEEPLQGKFASTEASVQRQEEVPRSNNTGLPDNLKLGIENLSGFSMDDVKVHYNSDKPAQFQALAYAQGADIHIAPGQGQHLPHEAWHVIQQKQGRVQPTMQIMEAVPINDDVGLEHEADVMGVRALQKKYISWNDIPYQHKHAENDIFQLRNYSTEAQQINTKVRSTWSINPGNRIDGLKASMGKSYGGKAALDYIVKFILNIPYVGNDDNIGMRASIAKAAKAANCDDFGDLAYSLFKELGNNANVAIEQQPGHTYGVAWDDGDRFEDQTIIDPWVGRGHLRRAEAYYDKPQQANKIITSKSDGKKMPLEEGAINYIMAHYDKNFVKSKEDGEKEGSKILDDYKATGKPRERIYE